MAWDRRLQRFTWSRKKGQSEKQEILPDQTFEIDATALKLICGRIHLSNKRYSLNHVRGSVNMAATLGEVKIKLAEVWTLSRSFEALSHQGMKQSASKQRDSIVKVFCIFLFIVNAVSPIASPLQQPDSLDRVAVF